MANFKVLKVMPRKGKRLTFNFAFLFHDDGTMYYDGEKWDAPFIVPPDHPAIIKALERGDVKLEDLKEDKPKIKKEA